MKEAEYTWISDDKVLVDLTDEKSVGSLNFFDVSFTDSNIQRMELALKGRKVGRIGITSCRGKLEEALSLIFRCVQVEYLKLDCLHINPTTAKTIADGVGASSSLKCLSLQAIHMTEHFAAAIHDALCRTISLEYLYLSVLATRLSDQTCVDTLLRGLQNNISLKHLGIAKVRGMDPNRVFQSVKEHLSLESISFACMDGISASTLAALNDLSRSPQSKVNTIKLSIRGDWTRIRHFPKSSVTARRIHYKLTISTSSEFCDMQVLGEILEQNDNIVALSLAHCGLDEDRIAQLACHLAKVKGLRELNLQGNSLHSGRGCDALLAALEYNRGLERIDLPTVVDQKASLDHLLDCNRAGRRLYTNTNVPRALWPIVLHRASKIDYTRSYPLFKRPEEVAARRANAIFHLLQGQAICH